ncbi:MAG: ATP-dependent sacrificial sulfur transferase LarE [Nitrospirae bacterium]|nr:ATP-dependent sacrificial sulfur transferase LarE [Nitrospirota bacterium]
MSLLSCLKEAGDGLLAFSGGVDSAFLLKAMQVAGIRTLAVTAVSDTMPAWDFDNAVDIANGAGVEHMIIRTDELSKEEFARNAPDRCFFCKDELFGRLRQIAGERGLCNVFDGSNADDLKDYRPGRRAASLHQVRSPLAECGFSKNEIRDKSKELGLSTWDRPSSPCLSSRFPYGRRITPDLLKKVEASEAFLRTLGLKEVRVRDCGDTARIEVGESEISIFMDAEARRVVSGRLKSLGYSFISLDLDGYKSGSLNRVLAGHNN